MGRAMASKIRHAKFISLSDLALILGQGLIVLTFTTYLALALYFFAKRHR
jgi:hypothetical protein